MTKVDVTQDSPGTEPVGDSHTHRDEKMRYRNCSHDGGGREMRQSAVGRREEQGSWSDAVPTPGAPTSKGRRRRCLGRSKERTHLPFLCLFVPFRPSEDGMTPACTGAAHPYSSCRFKRLSQKHAHVQTVLYQLPGRPVARSS